MKNMKNMSIHFGIYIVGLYILCVSLAGLMSACEEETDNNPRSTYTMLKRLNSIDVALTYSVLDANTQRQQARSTTSPGSTNSDSLHISINDMPATAKFARTFTEDFTDTTDDLYLFHRIYTLRHDSLPEESEFSIYLLVNKAQDSVEEALVQLDFIEAPNAQSATYKIDNEKIEDLTYDFENFTFIFNYNGDAKLERIDESLEDIFPAHLPALSLSVQGTR